MKKKYADMDPIEEVHAIRDELSRQFPTAKAFGDYVRSMYPLNPQPEPSSGNRRVAVKAGNHPASRRRKAPAHA